MTMKQEKKRIYLRAALALAALLVVLLALDNLSFVPSMLLTVLRKGAIYALVAVSMNLLNGFTGLFSLGQAGFMLLGAYTYAILTIPAASQKSIYQRYANGGIGFSIPLCPPVYCKIKFGNDNFTAILCCLSRCFWISCHISQ